MTGTWATGWATGDIVTASEYKKSPGSISDTTLIASAGQVDVTGIVQTYAHLKIMVYARGDQAALSSGLQMRFNGDSGANYDYQLLQGNAASASAIETFAAAQFQAGTMPAATAGANLFSVTEITIPNYAGSSNNKQFVSTGSQKTGTSTTNMAAVMFGGGWRSTAAITRITLFTGGTNFVAGTRVTIYAMGA